MSRLKRLAKTEQEVALLEARFRERLIDALQKCAAGRWGLFGRNDAALAADFGKVPEWMRSQAADDLLEKGNEIDLLRQSIGLGPYELYHRYLAYRSRRGQDEPGEPKLARKFLAELNA